ncbi:MAG: DUF262 domain-containing protein [Pseudonocardiaceae bacterium]
MKADLNYSPSDVYETLLRPELTERMDRGGEELDSFRRSVMLGRQLGLTKLYNLVHDPAVTDQEIQRLREIHTEIDQATAEAYSWHDLDLRHGFHDTRQGLRFTIAPDVQVEVWTASCNSTTSATPRKSAKVCTPRRSPSPSAAATSPSAPESTGRSSLKAPCSDAATRRSAAVDAKPKTPDEIFGTHIRYVIPPFQRPYVWEEEKQWEPLWDDVARTAELVLARGENPPTPEGGPMHFLGAVVLQHVTSPTGYIRSCNVVDGQQRLTTLQVLMDAVQEVVGEYGDETDAEALRDLVQNNPKKRQHEDEVFKVWPSRLDQAAFRAVMTNGVHIPEDLRESRIVQAHHYFRECTVEWAGIADDTGDASSRLAGLVMVLHRHLQLVAIDLTATDDPQIIFETLNDRGTPLLAADLVKNYVFLSIAKPGVDIDRWEREYWGDFDDPWWREEISQGRYLRSRIDIFLQYWLTMRLQDDVPIDGLFKRFQEFAQRKGIADPATAEQLLISLRDDARQFRSFANFEPETPEGTFYYRVVEAMQMGVATPVLLWLLSAEHAVPAAERARSLAALESWLVRRMLLRLTTKDINRMTVALLKELSTGEPSDTGTITERFLASQTAWSRYWPTDDELISSVATAKLYGVVQQGRIRMVLEAIEDAKRTAKSEIPRCPRSLQVEHIMPQSWHSHWGSDIDGEPLAAAARDRMVQTLGNLTLVTAKLNPSLANLPWLDDDATQIKPRSEGKRTQFDQHSLLLLNRELVKRHPDRWTEDDIASRGKALSAAVAVIWPRPASTI